MVAHRRCRRKRRLQCSSWHHQTTSTRSPRALPSWRSYAPASPPSGPITFRDFMAAALYHPKYGYYTTSAGSMSRGGDYVTSPEVHPIFGALVAKQICQLWHVMSRPRASMWSSTAAARACSRATSSAGPPRTSPSSRARCATASSRSARRSAMRSAAPSRPQICRMARSSGSTRRRPASRAACCRTNCSMRSRCIASCAPAMSFAKCTSRLMRTDRFVDELRPLVRSGDRAVLRRSRSAAGRRLLRGGQPRAPRWIARRRRLDRSRLRADVRLRLRGRRICTRHGGATARCSASTGSRQAAIRISASASRT